MEQNQENIILAEWNGQCGLGMKIPGEKYTLFSNRIQIQKGFFSRETTETRLNKIEYVVLKESMFGRITGIGKVLLKTRTIPIEKTTLRVKNPQEVLSAINQACYNENQAYLQSKREKKSKYEK